MMSVTKRSKVKSAALAALIAVNALLVAVLMLRHAPENQAQAAGARVGDVLAVPGQISGGSDGVVFLLDTANPPRLSVMTVDSANRANQSIQTMPVLNLDKVLNAPLPVRGGR